MDKQKGFALAGLLTLVGLIIVIAIIVIMFTIMYGKSENNPSSLLQTKKKAIEQTEQNNELLQQQNMEIQNQLNTMDSSGANVRNALDQAKKALQK